MTFTMKGVQHTLFIFPVSGLTYSNIGSWDKAGYHLTKLTQGSPLNYQVQCRCPLSRSYINAYRTLKTNKETQLHVYLLLIFISIKYKDLTLLLSSQRSEISSGNYDTVSGKLI